MNLKVRANLWKVQIFNLFFGMMIYLPFVIYYFQELGFSITQIMIMQAAQRLGTMFLEIPSGYFADKFGRKKSIVISVLFYISSLIILYSSTQLTPLIISYLFLGVAISFLSGAFSAIIYDTLLVEKREKEYKKWEGRANFFFEIGIISSSIIGFFIIPFGVKLTILVTLILQIFVLIISLLLVEPKVHHSRKLRFKQELILFKDTLKYSMKSHKLIFLFICLFFLAGLSNTIFLMYQPYFNSIGLSMKYFAIVFGIFSITTAISAFFVHDIEKKLKPKNALLFMAIILFISFLGAGLAFSLIAIIFFMLREFVRGIMSPIFNDYINKLVPSDKRSTTLSIGSFFSRSGTLLIALLIGALADIKGMQFAILSQAGIAFIFVIGLLFYSQKS